ncbi:hypothetical protein [Promicromonospora sp. NPDC023987]|uniref:hypothetical protein n=1 Tax=Promicromonospora sp. NPDC023987 TaxID=3155360 RepID=UPI0034051D88
MTTPTIEETTMRPTEPARAGHLRGVAAVDRRLRRNGAVVGIWFWAVYALYSVGITLGNAAAGNDLEISALDSTIGASRWLMIWLGISASVGILALHLAAGASRRSLFEGVVRGALVVGAGFGVVTTLALLGERVLNTSLGMSWARLGALPFDSVGAVLGTAVAEALVITTYILVGACFGAGFTHAGARGGFLIVPLAVPAVLVDLATRTGVVGVIANVDLRPDLDHAEVSTSEGLATTLLGIGGGVLAVVLAAVVLYALLRTVPVRPA